MIVRLRLQFQVWIHWMRYLMRWYVLWMKFHWTWLVHRIKLLIHVKFCQMKSCIHQKRDLMKSKIWSLSLSYLMIKNLLKELSIQLDFKSQSNVTTERQFQVLNMMSLRLRFNLKSFRLMNSTLTIKLWRRTPSLKWNFQIQIKQ